MKFNISCNSLLPLTRILEREFDRLDIAYGTNGPGYIEISKDLAKEQRIGLENSLQKYSISIIEDERECLAQRIKNILFEMVNSDKPIQKTLSGYLSEKIGFSYGYLTSVFASITFCSIEQYAILLRVERAKRMIIEDELSLKEISDSLYYSSLGHFSKQFKKSTGITLSEFRKIISRRRHGIH